VIEGVLHERLGVRAEATRFGRQFETWVQLHWIDPEGPAGRIGLAPEDVIVAIQPRGRRVNRVHDVDTLALLLSRLDHETSLEIEVVRDEDKDGFFFEPNELFRGTLVVR
jgi:hypothetical protein